MTANRKPTDAPMSERYSAYEERFSFSIYDQVREVMPLQGNLSIERMCELRLITRLLAFVNLLFQDLKARPAVRL